MARKIVEKVSEDQIQRDLEKYREYALELGATDAKVINTDDIVIDDRVVAKCTYPKCPGYGTNANCPPYAMDIDKVRKIVGNFDKAIFVKIDVPPEQTAGEEAIKRDLAAPYRRKMAEIVAKIEAQAFYDGYHLALAFGSGSCKILFCPDRDCVALELGKSCTQRLKARSPMEGVGMDVYSMATKVGWDIYAIGRATSPEEVPYGLRLGLVLIC
jgi:predicted metal-binding protein